MRNGSYRKQHGQHAQPLKICGSISLALCMILPVIIVLFSSVLANCRRVREETDLVRGAVSTAESALALYDRDLYATFGLFGINGQELDKALSSLIGPAEGAQYQIIPGRDLFEEQSIKDSIARHMTIRGATSLILDVVDKFKSVESLVTDIQIADLSTLFPPSLTSGFESVDPDLGFQDQTPEWFDEYTLYMDDQVRSVYQGGLSQLAPIILPKDNGEMETIVFNPFDNSGLDKLGTVLDRALFVAPEGILDRLVMSEYSLAYFKSDVSYVVRGGVRCDDKTPDGRLISLFPESRNREVEEIATGLDTAKAKQVVLLFIGASRFALHMLNILTDEILIEQYRTAAIAIALTVAAISLGEVSIPPEALTWILIVSAALGHSVKDAVQLNKGYEVDFWPGSIKKNIPMRYRDFIRFLIIMQSPDVIASRIAKVINRVMPGSYYTEVTCQADWGNVSVSHAARFITRQSDSDIP